jgi:hypothetical protein
MFSKLNVALTEFDNPPQTDPVQHTPTAALPNFAPETMASDPFSPPAGRVVALSSDCLSGREEETAQARSETKTTAHAAAKTVQPDFIRFPSDIRTANVTDDAFGATA